MKYPSVWGRECQHLTEGLSPYPLSSYVPKQRSYLHAPARDQPAEIDGGAVTQAHWWDGGPVCFHVAGLFIQPFTCFDIMISSLFVSAQVSVTPQ